MSDPAPWGPAPSLRRPGPITAVIVLLALAILVGLGVWQLQRLRWKEGVLARVAALQAAPARSLAELAAREPDLDFVRATVPCPDLERRPVLRLFAVRDGAAGYRLIAACPVQAGPYRSVLVDRGFVATEGAAAAMRPGRAVLPGPVVGVMRKGDRATFVTPANRTSENLWYSRDVAAMARQLGAEAPAPAYLMLERPAPEAGGAVPAPIPAEIPNRHLEYALTWFGLAAALVGVYVAMLLRRRQN